MNRTMMAGLAAVLVLAACGEKRESRQEAMPGMGDMPGMAGMTMKADSLMPMMRAHLDSLARVPAQFAGGMLAAHEAMASEMLDAMGADMAMMGMHADSAWTALADSVKRDLAELPALSGEPLTGRTRAHVARFRRLLEMHDRMMRSMQ